MSHPKHYAAQNVAITPVSHTVLSTAAVGAVIGGTAAAARNIRKVKNEEISRETAVKDVFKEAAGLGVAAGAATAIVKTVAPRSGLLGVIGIIALATGTKILWDSATESKTEAPEKEPAKTAKAPKTEKKKDK